MRALLATLILLASAGAALGRPPPPDDYIAQDPPVEWRDTPARFEWSTWVRLGVGVESEPSDLVVLSTTTGPRATRSVAWATGLGAEVSLPLGSRLRAGLWGELAGLDPMGGVELLVTRTPRELDLFWYEGEGVWMFRAGGGRTHATAAIARGYRAPWRLWGPYDRTSRYEIGVRIVAVASRAYDDPKDWSATLGIEFEPVGALRYVLGIKSWY